MTTQKKLIVWSGGFDSTALILDCIQKNIAFDIIYIKLINNEIKTKIEIYTRDLIKEKLSIYPVVNDSIDIIPMEIDISHQNLLSQPWIWLFGLTYFISSSIYIQLSKFEKNIQTYSEVLMGYIRGDCFWHISQQFKKNYYSLMSLSQIEDSSLIPKLVFPFEWMKKEDLYEIYKIKPLFQEVMDLTWTCENPKLLNNNYVECCKCTTCQNRIEMLKKLELDVDDHFNIKIPIEVINKKQTQDTDSNLKQEQIIKL